MVAVIKALGIEPPVHRNSAHLFAILAGAYEILAILDPKAIGFGSSE